MKWLLIIIVYALSQNSGPVQVSQIEFPSKKLCEDAAWEIRLRLVGDNPVFEEKKKLTLMFGDNPVFEEKASEPSLLRAALACVRVK